MNALPFVIMSILVGGLFSPMAYAGVGPGFFCNFPEPGVIDCNHPDGGKIFGVKFDDTLGDDQTFDLGVDTQLQSWQICVDGLGGGIPAANFPANDFLLPAAHAGEFGFLNDDICLFTNFISEGGMVGSGASYEFRNLPFDTPLNVYEILQNGWSPTTPLTESVTLTAANPVVQINFGNKNPDGPPDVSVGPSQYSFNGVPVVYWGSPFMVQKNLNIDGICDPLGAESVTATMGPTSETGTQNLPPLVNMQEIAPGVWKGTFPEVRPVHGTTDITFQVICTDSQIIPDPQILTIYIDPSGTVRNSCDNSPIEGAEVTLFHDPFNNGFFEEVPEGFAIAIPDVNPQITLANGQFGWVVIPGVYEVRVTDVPPGFVGNPSAGPFDIPPEVIGIDLFLDPVDGCPDIISGESMPLDNTALLVAGITSEYTVLSILTLAGAAGLGTLFFVTKRKF